MTAAVDLDARSLAAVRLVLAHVEEDRASASLQLKAAAEEPDAMERALFLHEVARVAMTLGRQWEAESPMSTPSLRARLRVMLGHSPADSTSVEDQVTVLRVRFDAKMQHAVERRERRQARQQRRAKGSPS